jgi:hypothetical protein
LHAAARTQASILIVEGIVLQADITSASLDTTSASAAMGFRLLLRIAHQGADDVTRLQAKHEFAISRRKAPEWLMPFPPKKREQGMPGCTLHPRSRVQIVRKRRTRAYRFSGGIRHSLRNGFTAYSVLSPVSRGSVATVAAPKYIEAT